MEGLNALENTLNWLSRNGGNLSEIQRREIHNLLDSFKRQLQTQTDPSSGNHQTPQFSGMASSARQYEKKYHNMDSKPDVKNASLESKINQVSNKISKETGYINGKIDTISKEYNDQIKMLRKQITKLESEQSRKEQVEKKVSDQDFEQLTESLKDLMKRTVSEPRPHPPNFNLPQHFPHYNGPPPPYQPYPPMAPNPNIPYFSSPPHTFHPMSVPVGPVPMMGSSFSYNQPGPPKVPSYDTTQKIYQFCGNSHSGAESGKHFTKGGGHPNPLFDKPFQREGEFDKQFHRESDGKTDSNPRKSYCSPHWKKFDNKNKEHGFKNESSNPAGGKPRFKTQPSGEQSSGDFSSKPKSAYSNQFKHYADRDRNKRHQQFGKNRPENRDDGDDSDTSTHSHVSSKNSGKEGAYNAGKPHQFKSAPKKSPVTSTGKSNTPNLRNPQPKPIPTTVDVPSQKNTQKKPPNKATHQRDCKTSLNQNPQPSPSKNQNQSMDVHKLQYPPRAKALKMGIDIFKRLDSPSTCLGKKNGVPVSRPAHCLEDIYNFEKEFGDIQVIRF